MRPNDDLGRPFRKRAPPWSLIRWSVGNSHKTRFSERPLLADFGLSHCNMVVQCSESAQKAANGKNRPFLVSRDLTVEPPLRSVISTGRGFRLE